MKFGATSGRESEDYAPREEGGRQSERPWSAILLAGTRTERDPLASQFDVPMKALIPVAGEPMIAHVVRALSACPSIGRILILAQEPEHLLSGDLDWIARSPRVRWAVSRGGIAESIAQVAGTEAAPWPVLVTTADHPLLTSEMIEHFLRESLRFDVGIGLVDRETLLRRFPATRRTWLRFRCGAYTGANLFALRVDRVGGILKVMAKAETNRKSQLKLFWHFGPLLALRAAAGTLSLEETIARLGARFGLRATPVALPFAEAGIDVDHPADHRLADGVLAARTGAARPEAEPLRVSVFDLDRTLTRRGTYTAFLVYSAWRRAPWRLLLTPAAALLFLAHGCGAGSRKQLKQRLQRLLLGPRAERDDVAGLARGFARRLRSNGFHREGVRRIEAERGEGRRIVLATAANDFYADEIARELGIDEIVRTRSVWEGGHLLPRIAGENCHGEDKLAMIEAHFAEAGLDRAALHVRFFTDHPSDWPALRWADEAFVVNPRRRFRARAGRAGWSLLRWT